MLCRTLNKHPELIVGEEILHKDHEKMLAWRKQAAQNKKEINYLSKEFIEIAFQKINGFKIMLTQIKNDSEIWEYLKSIKDLKIIFLYRKNFLDAFFSLKAALQTNVWQKEECKNKEYLLKPFYININEMLQVFKKTENELNYYKKFFKDHKKIEITYESLTNNWDEEFLKIQKFLSVAEHKINPQLEKLNYNYKVFIKNLKEVKNFLSNTKYKNFLDINL